MNLFSQEELKGRIKKVRNKMEETGIDCIMAFEWSNSYYLSGMPTLFIGRPRIPIIPLEGDSAIIVPMLEKDDAENYSVIRDVRLYDDTRNTVDSVIKLAKEFLKERMLESKKIGIEESTIPLSIYRNLKSELPSAEFVDISNMMAEFKMVKTKEEIELLKKMGEIADIGAGAFVDAVEVGKSELEISSEAVQAMEKEILKRFPSWPSSATSWCQSGLRALMPHSPSTGKKIKKGELVELNVFPTLAGYFITEERTLVVGEPSNEQKRAFEAMFEAREKAAEAVRPGVKCSQIDKIARDVFEKHGYGKYIRHGTGHGNWGIFIMGLGRSQKSELRIYNDNVLREGCIISIEPGIYPPNMAFRHADMALVTKEGYEFLTNYDRGIITV